MEGANFLKLEELILLAIAGKSEIYGLEIATDIAKASEDKVQLNYGSLYPYLNRLEKKGYISSRWEEENERKGARRKYYQITNKGTQSLDDAKLIRQQLRKDVPIVVTRQIQLESGLDKLLPILQYPEEKERTLGIYRLEYEAKVKPTHYWEIMKALAAFTRINSQIEKEGSLALDIQTALDVIGNCKIDRFNQTTSIDLTRTNLRKANLEGACLEEANFSGANLKEACLREACLEEANFREANLTEACLSGACLREADFSGANLRGANLLGVYLSGANLRGANLLQTNLIGADLTGSDLSGANLTEADLVEADLSGANLRGANLRGTELNGVQNMTIEQLQSARNWEQAIGISDYLK